MEAIKKRKWSIPLILFIILLIFFLFWLYLLYFGLPTKQIPTIPPYKGLVNIKKIEPQGDIQSVLSFKLKEKGNAADYYLKAINNLDSTIYKVQPVYSWYGPTQMEYNQNYPDIQLIVEGSKYKNCEFPLDFYYQINTSEIDWPPQNNFEFYRFRWAEFLTEATYNRATILIVSGEYKKGLEHLEAIIGFNKHVQEARLSMWDTVRATDNIMDGLEYLMDFYKFENDKILIEKCLEIYSFESTYNERYYDIRTTIFLNIFKNYISYPKIPNFPSVFMTTPTEKEINPLIELALYHKDRSIRIKAFSDLGWARLNVTKKIAGLPILDGKKQREIEFVLIYIKTHDPDPLVRDMASKALQDKNARRIRFYW